ncbi:unnamed protein product, partial [Discosporangium mesarthrocarpum]
GDSRAPAFDTGHVRSLVEVAGSRTLEERLKASAAGQLRSVLLAPGVASAIEEGSDKTLCQDLLQAALHGLYPDPQHATSGTTKPSTDVLISRQEAYLGLLWAALWLLPSARTMALKPPLQRPWDDVARATS